MVAPNAFLDLDLDLDLGPDPDIDFDPDTLLPWFESG